MKIDRNSFVVFEYVLRNEEGELIEASRVDNPPSFIFGYQMLIPGLEKRMKNHEAGDKFDVSLIAEEAYGQRDEGLVVTVPRMEIPEEVPLSVGSTFDAVNDRGEQIKLTVHDITSEEVVLDANHPLAGQALQYEITVREVRPATEDELMNAAAPLMGTDSPEKSN